MLGAGYLRGSSPLWLSRPSKSERVDNSRAPRHPRARDSPAPSSVAGRVPAPRLGGTPTVLSNTLQSCFPSLCCLKVQVRFSWFSSQPRRESRAGGLRKAPLPPGSPHLEDAPPWSRCSLTPKRGCRPVGGAGGAAAVHGAGGAGMRCGGARSSARTRADASGRDSARLPAPRPAPGKAHAVPPGPTHPLGPAALTLAARRVRVPPWALPRSTPSGLSRQPHPVPRAALRSC